MGLAWQQGPLASSAAGHFLVPKPLPERLLFAEPLRRRLRVRLGGAWVADSEDVVLLHEPGRYPVAYLPLTDVADGALEELPNRTRHCDLGTTSWYAVHGGDRRVARGAWRHVELPAYADVLVDRVAFGWRQMDAFYEEDERILGHAADAYHRIDIRNTSRHLVVRSGLRVVADTHHPVVLYESGFAPRWYVARAALVADALTEVDGQTFCPYKGLATYYDIDGARRAAWCYPDAYPEVGRVSDLVSFEPNEIEVTLDGTRLHLEPGQAVAAHGFDRDLTPDELN